MPVLAHPGFIALGTRINQSHLNRSYEEQGHDPSLFNEQYSLADAYYDNGKRFFMQDRARQLSSESVHRLNTEIVTTTAPLQTFAG